MTGKIEKGVEEVLKGIRGCKVGKKLKLKGVRAEFAGLGRMG